jgi:hypothetical protein
VARYYGVFDRPPVAVFDYLVPDIPQEIPVADFDYRTPERTLKYMAPNSEEEIQFLNRSIYNGNNPLTCSLYIDDQLVTTTATAFDPTKPIYSAKLPASAIGTEHKVRLEVKEGTPKDRPVILLNESYDPDAGLPSLVQVLLGVSSGTSCEWFVNGQEMSTDTDYSLRLTPGDYQVGLAVSDGRKEDFREKTVTIPAIPEISPVSAEEIVSVDPADLPEYPKKQLKIPIKGINVSIGCSYVGYLSHNDAFFPPVMDDELLEQLLVVRDEIGCNGVRLFGNENERMLSAVQIAKDLHFSSIMCSPRYIEADLKAIIDLISPFAEELETLRDNSIILSVGNELSLDAFGLMPGETYGDRQAWMDGHWAEYTSKKRQEKVNEWLREIVQSVRPRFRGTLTYSPIVGEEVQWNNIGFDVVGTNNYYATHWDKPEDYLERINNLCKVGKPTYLTEWGYFTFRECLEYGGAGWTYLNNPGDPYYHGDKPVDYSQQAQAQAIDECVRLLNQTRLNGIYLYAFVEKKPDDAASTGVLKFDQAGPSERKQSFYRYKSYTPS